MVRILIAAAVALGALVGYLLIVGGPAEQAEPNAPSQRAAAQTSLADVPDFPLRDEGESKTYVVLMNSVGGRFVFQPAALRVQPGDTVLWWNLGDNHSTTAYAPPNTRAGGVSVPQRIPEGAQSWDSGILGIQERGITFSYTFELPGTYDYYCFPHEFLGMVGRIVAGAPGGPAEGAGPEGLSEDAAAQLEALPSELIASKRGTTFAWEAELNAAFFHSFNDEHGAALQIAQRLVDGADQIAPLLGGEAERFRALLAEFRDLVESDAGFGPLSDQRDELVALLAGARS